MVDVIPCPGQRNFVINEDDYAWSFGDEVDRNDINPVVQELTNSLQTKIQKRFADAVCVGGCNKGSSGLSGGASPVGRPYRRWWSLWLVSVQKIQGHAQITVFCTPHG